MTDGDLCVSCGGRIVSFDDGLFRCEFCGKFYSDEKECSDIEVVRKLWKKGNRKYARTLMRDVLASDPNNDLYLLESLRIDLDADSVADYLEKNLGSDQNLERISKNVAFITMTKCSKGECGSLTKELERYIELRNKINGIKCQNEHIKSLVEFAAEHPEKPSFAERIKELRYVCSQNSTEIFISFFAGCVFTCFLTYQLGLGMVLLAPIGGLLGIGVYWLCRVESKNESRMMLKDMVDQNRSDVSSLPVVIDEANEAFTVFARHEKAILERSEG